MFLSSAAPTVHGVDNAEALGILHNLFSMTFTPQGLEAVIYVLGLDDNVRVLLPFVEHSGEPWNLCSP